MELKITNRKGETFTVLFDAEDYKIFLHKKIWIDKAKRTQYAVCGGIKVHHIIMNIRPSSFFVVDHIDGNGLNNMKSNLRVCTHRENLRNRKPAGKSKYLGVCIIEHKNYKDYYATLRIDGIYKLVKHFKNEIEAAKSYDEAAKKYYGEFAHLNFPN